ncbi:hypothetical protein JCM15519_22610 [Fundidesulfovibrio butyratiphilus]
METNNGGVNPIAVAYNYMADNNMADSTPKTQLAQFSSAGQGGLGAAGGQNHTMPPATGEQNSTKPKEFSFLPPPVGWTSKQNPDKDGIHPILHPIEFYQRAKELRSWGQKVAGEHKDSDARHATVSYLLTKEYGPNWTRLAGLANEVQGFFWHDIFDLPARYSGERPWAFSTDDLVANEVGIQKAEQEIEAQKQP